ncbi:hypothetical protein IJ472_04035 [bacterium]|nr:hypothetical protein [bacterium]
MGRFIWTVGIIIFVLTTVIVVSVDTSQTRRVRFSNQDFAIKNDASDLNATGTNIQLSDTNITNKQISANSNLKLSSSDLKVKSSDIDLNSTKINSSSTKFSGQGTKFDDNTRYSTQKSKYDDYDIDLEDKPTRLTNNSTIDYKNLDTEQLDIAMNNAKNRSNQSTDISNQPFRQMHVDRYEYENIDWNTWRSNFVNKILDDSLAIRSLDNYKNGSWFYYSFDVSSVGKISNITIKSIHLSDEDKEKVAELIKSYEYKNITKFPKNTRRSTAKVSAVMMLSTETQHSKPSDFNDFERIKFKVK